MRLGVDLQGTIWLILIAHAFFNVAVVVRTVGRAVGQPRPAGWRRRPAPWARPGWRAFREVTLPLLRPAIAAAASIVFLFCFTSFGVVLLLGGIRARTLEVEIYDQTTQLLHLDVAAVLAMLQLVGVTAGPGAVRPPPATAIGRPARCGPGARWRAGPAVGASGASWSRCWP